LANIKWVNVRKQKPPLDTPILLYVRYRYGSIVYIGEYVIPPNYKKRAIFATNIRRGQDRILDGFLLEYVTHWMPLPEPPKFRKPPRR